MPATSRFPTWLAGSVVHLTFIWSQPGVHYASLASPSVDTHDEDEGGRSMRNARKLAGIVAGVLAFSLIAAACGSDNNDSGSSGSTGATGGTGSLSGSITVSGSSTVLPISNLVAELFSEQNPDVQVSVDGPGTGDGFVLFCKGETDISDASRPIADDEKKACSDGGIDYVELRDRVRRDHGHDEPAEQRGLVPGFRRPVRAVRPAV